MKQIIQNFKTGETSLEDIPVPQPGSGKILIRTTHSLVSLGTERSLVEFGKANLVQKARQQPDKVKQVLDKIKSDGLLPTLETVFKRLDEPLSLGYCNVGTVVETGAGVTNFSVGDLVASNGKHAEYVCVPTNLVAKVPGNVSSEEAAFTVIGSIGLQGIRLIKPTFGETIVVYGLGLLGLLSAQMLLANGRHVIGIDIDETKCELARTWGVTVINPATGNDPVKAVMESTGAGADGVLITASSKSQDIISNAAQMSRKRGRIVLVGVIGLNISRAEFYEKELTFQVSCSYGPGRYDENYEQRGMDYPLPFVRWTEKRNFEAVLKAIASGSLHVRELISEMVPIEDYLKIYDNIGQSRSIASILTYPEAAGGLKKEAAMQVLESRSFAGQKAVTGFIGAGNFTKMTMLPNLKGSGASFKYMCSSGGLSGTTLAKKFGFSHSTTDYKEVLKDEEVDTVFITTRHNSHANFVKEALQAGKNVFVEKPLAINQEQLNEIIEAYEASSAHKARPTLTVGFNRRFSPHTQAIKKAIGKDPGVLNIVATMNAGFIPSQVWVHDMKVGGGRIIGEACHYMDLCAYLAGSEIKSVCMNSMGTDTQDNTDNASILMKFKNGSTAVINYFANGSKSYSKERIEVFSQERVFVLDNFRTTTAYGVKGFKKLKTKMNKGHKAQFHTYIQRIKEGGDPLIAFSEMVNVTKASFAALQSLKEKQWIDVE
ncbi:MAG: dehydrogenase [Bacteroidia bacterium]|nr:MAG: dehydrogenase [Bacteroidia bacterium]